MKKEQKSVGIDKIKKLVIEAKYKNVSSDIERLQDNNIRFRPHDKKLLVSKSLIK